MQKRFPYILKTTAILLFFPLFLLGQDTENKTNAFGLKNVAGLAYFEDPTRALTFDDILDKQFVMGQTEKLNIQSKYWYRLSIPEEANRKLLFLYLIATDFSDIYVPVKGSETYERHTIGHFAKREKNIVASPQFQILSIRTTDIDFSKPFFFNKTAITYWTKSHWHHIPQYFFSDNQTPFMRDMLQIHQNQSDKIFYIGVVFISFFLFLVNFFISKNKSFLVYGLYLLGVALYYANRLPWLINFYQKSSIPEFYFYVNQLAYVANIGCYIWFVFYFLDFKHEFPKAYPFTRSLLLGILAFGVLYGFQIVLFPYFPYRFLLMDSFRLATMVSSTGLFVFLMFQKSDIIAKIVLAGSLVLIVANVLSLILDDHTIFLKLMVLEIILFSIVVALRNKQVDDRRIKNRYELEVEKMKTKTMEELNATKARFYENITHEFRTPLTLILSPVERKLSTPQLPSEEKKELNLIRRNAQRLLGLINQMLDLAKLDAGNVTLSAKQGDLKAVLQPIIDSFQKEALGNKKHFTTNIKDLKNGWFDRDIVEKITSNLLSNALKYTPENGSINVETYIKNGYWIFVITNTTTPGIDIDVSQLFERYYRAGQDSEGVGIGLSLIKELVELAHGNIVAKLIENNDIQFRVSLPADSALFADRTPENEIPESFGIDGNQLSDAVLVNKETFSKEEIPLVLSEYDEKKPPKLLIVEDNPEMRAFIVSNFPKNYKILEAENGKTGIEMALKHLPDIIVSDVMMPVKSGIDLCNELKFNEQTSHIPIILLTAKAGDNNEIEGLQSGADDYITKPFNPNILKLKIQNLLHSREKLKELYSNTFNLSPELFVTSTEQDFLQRLEKITKEHITDPALTSEEFSRLMGMSRSQLHKKLHAVLGVSTSEFIRSQRLKMAKELLKSKRNVAEISYLVGFNTPSYFSKCFKETFGCTPVEFQENTQ